MFLELFFLPCFRFRLFFLCLPFFFSFLCLGRLPDLPELRSEDCSGERDHAETLLSSHLLNEWSFSLSPLLHFSTVGCGQTLVLFISSFQCGGVSLSPRCSTEAERDLDLVGV